MIERKDLTRWNRAGQSRFTYVDGNAVEYLEILRQQLVKRFVGPLDEEHKWLKPSKEVPANEKMVDGESLVQRQERLSRRQERILEMYHQDRRDWAWEITRTFARSCHILTNYAGAYANEGYLGTATQWDHVRRLVEMLDYHPAPPASASTKLVLEAKEGKSGLVKKGWQVKYKPPDGGEKIIFETLEDLSVDYALNELRPKGWNQSDDLVSQDDQPAVEERQFSDIANGPAINLQGVGDIYADKFNTLFEDEEVFKIKDFIDLVPDSVSGLGISETRIREFKAMATAICNFKLESNWSAISGWTLPRIAAENPDLLEEITGNPVDIVEGFQHRIELIGAFLDNDVYEITKLEELVVPQAVVQGSVVTAWYATPKSNVAPGQLAMVSRELRDEAGDSYIKAAEVVKIASVDEQTKVIRLLPGVNRDNWINWSKSEARLNVTPRFKRECWLNGGDVIRTKEPHGLKAESYICWKINFALTVRDDLVNIGRNLINVALIGGKLHIRIFNEDGGMAVDDGIVIDKREYPVGAEYEVDALFRGQALTFLKGLYPLPPGLVLSPEDKTSVIEKALSCAGYTHWKHAKVIEADKRDLRLEVTGSRPKDGEEIFEMLPIEGSVLPASFDAVVLIGNEDESVDHEAVPIKIKEPEDPIFTLKEVVAEEAGGGGGGVLPAASLPKVGCFLFPSPLLPVDLVKAAVELMLSIGVMAIPSTEEIVIKGMPFSGLLEDAASETAAAESLYKMLNELEGVVVEGQAPVGLVTWRDDIDENEVAIIKALEKMITMPKGEEATILFKKLTEEIIGLGPLLAMPKKCIAKAVVTASKPLYMFNGTSKIAVDDWVVCEFSGGLRALKVSSIDWFVEIDKAESFSLTFEDQTPDADLKMVYADFRAVLIAKEATVNNAKIEGPIELEEVPESLKVGKEILLTAEGKEPVAAKIEDIIGNSIRTNPSAKDFKKGELIIRANVVGAGHGEGKPAKILGSGNAAKSNQEFTLEVEAVSFTPDATMSSGVAAAIDVEVAGQIWKQVPTLKDSKPDDHHYAIRMTEEGYVRILFGDGQYARRLPTGKNNIRVRHRVGSGLTGNVLATSLEKPVSPHPLIERVLQIQMATGGGDMESIDSLRENAPPTLLALERAVSLSDFSHLATSQSSIWQATAYSEVMHECRMEIVKVVIVPAGGAISDDNIRDMRTFLQKHALPGLYVDLLRFEPVLFSLRVVVRVKFDEYIPEEVVKAVTLALSNHFILRKRKLGQHLYLSEVYKVVEGIQGVENSICVINVNAREDDAGDDDANRQVIRAVDQGRVVYFDTKAVTSSSTLEVISPSTLIVTYEEYMP